MKRTPFFAQHRSAFGPVVRACARHLRLDQLEDGSPPGEARV